MKQTITVVYENGVLRPLFPLNLPEQTTLQIDLQWVISPQLPLTVMKGGLVFRDKLAVIRRQLRHSGYQKKRTKFEIDAQIEAERASWEA